ncbi:MAG: NADH:ubiquinone reductase (Na(+)-transporting) subunit B [Bacteroidetes bacterium 4572_128]|nr:MAG: NADH:ubiquinone reductase (Na(+)-transporting) subunit B [Bacteroidetes bacterium 4572_128]
MKAIRKILDNVKPHVQKGGKFEKFHSTFDAFESFLFVPNEVTKNGTHIRDCIDLKRTMSVVVMALMPALFFGMWNTGYLHFLSIGETNASFFDMFFYGLFKVMPLVAVSYIAGLGAEFVFAQIRGHEVNEGFLVSGMIIPLIVPIDVPLWMLAVATIFSVIIGKEVFGGTGMNIVNPALLARAFLFFAYPSKMSGDKIWITDLENGKNIVDGFSGATPLGDATANIDPSALPSTLEMFMGTIPGSVGETSVLMILIGAFILIYTGIASWKIMLSGTLGGFIMAILMFFLDPSSYTQIMPYQHLFLGGFAFGIVFMATDPVTASQTEKGKWIYGFLVGFLAILVRVLNPAYPEGMMLAILLMNVFAPLIDYYVVEGNIKKRLKRAK